MEMRTVNLVEDISDGSQQTILVTEGFTHIPWTKPEDLQFDDETALPPVHPHPDGWNVIFADGATPFCLVRNSCRCSESF